MDLYTSQYNKSTSPYVNRCKSVHVRCKSIQVNARPCKSVLVGASQCKSMSSACKPLQVSVCPCKSVQDHTNQCKPIRVNKSQCKSPCKAIQVHASPSVQTMQISAIQCKIVQASSSYYIPMPVLDHASPCKSLQVSESPYHPNMSVNVHTPIGPNSMQVSASQCMQVCVRG